MTGNLVLVQPWLGDSHGQGVHLMRDVQGLFNFLDLQIGFVHSLADNGLDQRHGHMVIDLLCINTQQAL